MDPRKKPSEVLLRIAVALCLILAIYEVGKTVYNHIPPYSVGTCFGTVETGDLLQFKITENSVLTGYSKLHAKSIFFETYLKASFKELREDQDLIKTNCF
jgi:hypothetical protein